LKILGIGGQGYEFQYTTAVDMSLAAKKLGMGGPTLGVRIMGIARSSENTKSLHKTLAVKGSRWTSSGTRTWE